jgi:hypothetical protein
VIPRVTLRKALADEQLLGGVVADDSWRAWRILLIAAMGEPLTDDERAIFTKLTGRDREPLQSPSKVVTPTFCPNHKMNKSEHHERNATDLEKLDHGM